VPIYQYQCPDCCSEFERIQIMDAPETTDCLYCDGELAKRIPSVANFEIRGIECH
jgi:putative FmdB family regulatory protein